MTLNIQELPPNEGDSQCCSASCWFVVTETTEMPEQRSTHAEVSERAPSENQPGCFVADNELLGQDKAPCQLVAQRRNLPEVEARVKAGLYITSVPQASLLDGGGDFETIILNQSYVYAPALAGLAF